MALAFSNNAVTTVGNGTLTAANLLGGLITRTGPTGAFTDTTDTAANIIAALYGLPIGSTFVGQYLNVSGQTVTLAGGSGVTLTANTGTSLTVATAKRATILFTIASATTVTASQLYLSATT